MNAHTFDSHSVTCPICQRSSRIKTGQLFSGLYTCPYCQERLVITWSGHYVRDPFNLRQMAVGRMLRRQSHPMARIIRDFGLAKHSPLLAVLAGAIVLGVSWISLETWKSDRNPLEGLIEQVTEVIESSEFSP